jgi:hypothetical protein
MSVTQYFVWGMWIVYRESVKQSLLGRTVHTTAALTVIPTGQGVSNCYFQACAGCSKLPYRNQMSGL